MAGSIGPLGAPSHEVLELSDASVRSTFRETIEGLLEGGIDLFWFETFPTIDHLAIAVEEARAISADVPIVALLTFGEDVALADGMAWSRRARSGAARRGRGRRRELRRRPRRLPRWPHRDGWHSTVILPNAGLPQRIEGQFVYSAGPEYFGRMVGDMLEAGAAIVGGCCGTTPEHIAAMRTAIDERAGRKSSPTVTAPRRRRSPSALRSPRPRMPHRHPASHARSATAAT